MDKREVLSKDAEFSKRAESYLSFNKAVLFGSYIDGNPREDSDLDIAFFVDRISEEIDYLTLLVLLQKLAREIDSRIEPYIITVDDESGFGNYIFKNGKEIIYAN